MTTKELNKLMREQGYATQRHLSRTTGIDHTLLCKIIRGLRVPTLWNALLISRALDEPVENIFPIKANIERPKGAREAA